jgi:hypothetical protein
MDVYTVMWIWLSGVAAVILLGAFGAWLLTQDDYRGVHAGRDSYPQAAHRARGLDDPTQVVNGNARGVVSKERLANLPRT